MKKYFIDENVGDRSTISFYHISAAENKKQIRGRLVSKSNNDEERALRTVGQ